MAEAVGVCVVKVGSQSVRMVPVEEVHALLSDVRAREGNPHARSALRRLSSAMEQRWGGRFNG